MPHPFPGAPPPPIPHSTKPTVKLALEGDDEAAEKGPFVRVQLPGQGEALALLRQRAIDLYNATHTNNTVADGAKVLLTYRDVENDLCCVFSEEDLRCALPVFPHPATLKMFARIEEPEKMKDVVPSAADASSTTRSSSGSFKDIPVHKVVETVVGVLTAANVALQKHVKVSRTQGTNTPTAQAAAETPATEAPKKEEPTIAEIPEEEKRLFIHGRHTCDGCLTTPIVGTRFHAVNLPDYDLCMGCHSEYKGSEIKFEEQELERDRPMQERWYRRFNKWSQKNQRQAERQAERQAKRQAKQQLVRLCNGGPPHGGPPHGGPRKMPPHGGPPHAGPRKMPPHGGPPHGGPRKMPPPFAPRPHHHGVPPRQWNRHPRCFGPPPAACGPPPEQVDQALKEAIRRSMEDLKLQKPEEPAPIVSHSEPCQGFAAEAKPAPVEPKEPDLIVYSEPCETFSAKAKPALVEEPKVEEQPAASAPEETEEEEEVFEEEYEIPPEAPVGAPPARPAEQLEEPNVTVVQNAVEQHGSKSPTDDSFTNDAEGNGDVAAALGETMDAIANAIDEMTAELVRNSSEDGSQKSEVLVDSNESETKAGATIVSGEEEEEEVKSDDGSQNSWNMVANDEALARAARVIGSALFESEISRNSLNATNEDVSMLDSDHSIPSTLPSVATVAQAQLDRWALQLRQLHELGFNNDAANVEIMERLQAANIGSGEDDEEISVEKVINELMRDW